MKKYQYQPKPFSSSQEWLQASWVLGILDELLAKRKLTFEEWEGLYNSIVREGN